MNGKFNPSCILGVIIILDKLKEMIKDTSLQKKILSSEINRLREKLLDLNNHV